MTAESALETHFRASSDREPLLVWYAVATIATSASSLAYLVALRGIVANDSSASALGALTSLFWLGGLFAPVIVAVKGAILAVVIWSCSSLLGATLTYRACLRAMWIAEPLLVLPQFVAGVVAIARGMTSRRDLSVPLGIDLFWIPDQPMLATIAHMVNMPLVLWGGVIWWCLVGRNKTSGNSQSVVLGISIAAIAVVLLPAFQLK